MTTQALIDTYYAGLARREGWEQTIAEDFTFTGAAPNRVTRGKASYLEAVRRYGRLFETVTPTRAIVDEGTACVIARYGLVSPAGKTMRFDIAEVWTAEGGRLTSLAIYYDTETFNAFVAA
jgi:ketosteroid isomerase-like protein